MKINKNKTLTFTQQDIREIEKILIDDFFDGDVAPNLFYAIKRYGNKNNLNLIIKEKCDQ
jgi:hypothetical protein